MTIFNANIHNKLLVMSLDFSFLSDYFIPATVLTSGLVLGIIIEKIILPLLNKFALKTKWKGDDVIFASLKGLILTWLLLLSVYLCIFFTPNISTYLILIKNTLLVILIMTLTLFLKRLVVGFLKLYTDKFASLSIISNISIILIYGIGILVILQTLGLSITPVITALGIGGLAVALAMNETLANVFSGMHLIMSTKIQSGDYIKLDSGEEGYITDITWRSTTIKEISNNMIIVPNSRLSSAVIKNYYLPHKHITILVDVGVSYSSDLTRVENITLEVASETIFKYQEAVSDFKPFIRYHTFGDSSINFTVHMQIHEFYDQYLLKHEFIKKLHERYNTEGIEIPFPIRTIYMKNE